MRAMLAAAPMPIWLRDETRRAASGSTPPMPRRSRRRTPATRSRRGLELLDTPAAAAIAAAHADDPVFATPPAGDRRRRAAHLRRRRHRLGERQRRHRRRRRPRSRAARRRSAARSTSTPARSTSCRPRSPSSVPTGGCRSYNAAYRALFGLDAAFLDSAPDETRRARPAARRAQAARTGRLPRAGATSSSSAYRSPEAREHWWHLPDGQTLRVIANPHPAGRHHLGLRERHRAARPRKPLQRAGQRPGRDPRPPREGVAVFGSDGRLRLHNPSFAADLVARPRRCSPTQPARLRHRRRLPPAGRRRGDVAALHRLRRRPRREPRLDLRAAWSGADGRVIDYATVPLPDGQTMVTFVDVTDSVQVERALVERNEALEAADALKNAFIHHVSYELRSPLTNIIGFAQLLADAARRPAQRQAARIYRLHHVVVERVAARHRQRHPRPHHHRRRHHGARPRRGRRRRDRRRGGRGRRRTALAEAPISASKPTSPPAPAASSPTSKRVRQILFNLLVNAIAFSHEGGRVERLGAAASAT